MLKHKVLLKWVYTHKIKHAIALLREKKINKIKYQIYGAISLRNLCAKTY